MVKLQEATHCRLSGEKLADATLLLEIPDCPVPGLYPPSLDVAIAMRSPLKVLQAHDSGFVQLGHVFDAGNYTKYAFSGGISTAYRKHLTEVTEDLVQRFDCRNTRILEVGCGDGTLLRMLRARGFVHVYGIDPCRAAQNQTDSFIACGFFPKDLPVAWTTEGFDLIITRHVLEHIETPVPFVRAMAAMLRDSGVLCIEVPDLDSTLRRGLWSNFYQLHCNYFSVVTLDRLLASSGLAFLDGRIVEVFGGSIFRYYRRGPTTSLPNPERIDAVSEQVLRFRNELAEMTAHLQPGAVGYGAAERTAMMLGLCPELMVRISQLHDGNPLLHGRFLAGTPLCIGSREALYTKPPPAIVLFAISNACEIIQDFQRHLPGATFVGVAGRGSNLTRLAEITT